MLTIRKQQFEALHAIMRQRFLEKLMSHVREVFPEQTENMPDAELRALLEGGMKRSSGYSITGEREVALFVDLLFGLGKDFEIRRKHAWIREILQSTEFDQQEKMDLIYSRLEAISA